MIDVDLEIVNRRFLGNRDDLGHLDFVTVAIDQRFARNQRAGGCQPRSSAK